MVLNFAIFLKLSETQTFYTVRISSTTVFEVFLMNSFTDIAELRNHCTLCGCVSNSFT